MAATIEVLSPAGVRQADERSRSAGVGMLSGKVAGILDNHKANSAAFLKLLADDLVARHGVVEVVAANKATAAKPVEAATLERFRDCDFAVTAFAD